MFRPFPLTVTREPPRIYSLPLKVPRRDRHSILSRITKRGPFKKRLYTERLKSSSVRVFRRIGLKWRENMDCWAIPARKEPRASTSKENGLLCWCSIWSKNLWTQFGNKRCKYSPVKHQYRKLSRISKWTGATPQISAHSDSSICLYNLGKDMQSLLNSDWPASILSFRLECVFYPNTFVLQIILFLFFLLITI